MMGPGYVYIVNWEKFQHYKTRRPAWLKFYVDLLGNDEWLELAPSDVKLLCALWMLAGIHGNGRVRADESWLRAQAKAPRSNLKALRDAGFIEVRASKALAPRYQPASDPALTRVKEKEKETPISPLKNGSRGRAVTACQRLAQTYRDAGEPEPVIREWLENEYRHDTSIVQEALERSTA